MRTLGRLLVALAVAVPALFVTIGGAQAAPIAPRLSRTAIKAGQGLTLTGVTAPSSEVVVAWRRGGTWQRLATVAAGAAGGYRVALPTWWVGRRHVQVTTGETSSTTSYTVTPRHRARGSRTAFRRYVDRGSWNPCGTITWKFNPRGGYAGSLADMRKAINEVASATGLRFAYRGRTRKIAFRDGAAAAGTDLLVSWASPRQVSTLSGDTVGNGMSTLGFDGYYHRADLALDRTEHLRPGFHAAGAIDWGQIMLHELGHVMGLDHVGNRSAIMYPSATRAVHHYDRGDLAGLAKVGASRPCA